MTCDFCEDGVVLVGAMHVWNGEETPCVDCVSASTTLFEPKDIEELQKLGKASKFELAGAAHRDLALQTVNRNMTLTPVEYDRRILLVTLQAALRKLSEDV